MSEARASAVVAIGDPWHGLVLVGPFESVVKAIDWAGEECRGETWEAVPLEDPAVMASASGVSA